jgi:two-component system, OmpR family, response regulator
MTQEKTAIPEKAMIIEDEKDLCYLLSIVLRQNHVSSSCAYSITEARKTIKNIRPSMIFLDNHLPDGSGIDFIGQAKARFPLAKIIMITAHDSPSEIDAAFSNGADYFITKPFNTSTIKTTIDFFRESRKD